MTKSPRDPEASYTQEVTPRPTKNLDASSQDASKIPVLQDKPKPSQPAFVSFCALYRYASPSDLLCLVVGLLAAASAGALAPCTALVFGNAVASFQRPDGGVDSHAINKAAIEYVVLAGLLFLADYLAYVLLMHSAERQMHALRLVTLKHMLFMDMSWFDAQTTSALSSRLTGDTVKIKDGMGYKLGLTVKHTSQFATGSVIAFVKGWDMALVMWCVMPFTVWSLRVLITTTIARAVQSQVMYSQAHAIAEETLGSIRTVAAMTAEHQAIAKYNAQIAEAEATAIKQERVNALVKGFVMGGSWVMYAAGLWYGGSRVADAARSPSEMFQGFFAMLFGAGSLAQISTNLTTVTQARGIAAAIYGILATDSAVDASKRDGVVPDTCHGRIEAVDVHFAYPSRPDIPVLHAYNVVIEPGHTVAFVGASGEGKSTLVALLERFYSPQQGAIMLDGRDLRTLNITWLRSQIGLVSQEPVLFGRSIFENIAIGSSSSVTRDQVVHAARVANAHDFIVALPQQYDTPVGEMGVALSGGQKQRLAIARAIVRDPKILVLDEATSALDAESESCVQDSLKQLLTEKGRTTIVIAHRLSTIRHADKIVVVSNGQVIEQGRHADLLVINNGIYRKLYTKQVEKTQDGGSGVVETEIPVQSTLKDVVEGIQPLSPTSAQTIPVKVPTFSVRDALQLPRQDIPYFALAVMAIAVSALALPGSSLLISAMANSLALQFAKYEVSLDRSYLDKLADDVTLYGVCYIAGSSAVFLTTATHTYCFGYISERVLARLRSRHFTALCRQDIAFYDDPNHTAGALSADLSIHANKVAAITGSVLGGVVDAVWTFLAALLISFVLGSWKLSLVMLAIVPLLMVAGAVRSNHLRAQRGHADDLAVVGAHASEALTSIRTVASFGLEDRVIERFHYLLRDLLHQGRAEAQINGLAIGFASFVVYAAQGLAFWYGGKLVDQREISFLELMRSLMAIMMAANGIGYVLTFLGDAEKARKAGGEIISVCSRQPVIDSFDERGLVPATVEGAIQFKDVSFRYPSRPSVQVLQKYNLTIAAGETVAFCGPSGGGKSTCLALLERFYDPDGGTVFLDGHDLRQLNVHWLRRQIGLVSQEPTLFSGTIAENIAYGCDHEPSQEQVEAAAAVANAHGFITQFPDGYATAVGAKGEQLSGGQKQRIAIARAVLKNPKILLLDEATSALDMESEVVVQAALDNAMRLRRRTTLIIAHRLSTIRSANRICVVSGGTIVEQGTHGELLVRGGVYSALVEAAST